MTVKEMRSQLEARGIEIPKGARKAQLAELLAQPDSREAAIAELLAQRSEATSPGVKAALTKRIQALGGAVPGHSQVLTAEAVEAAREDGDSPADVLERLGFAANAARKARLSFLVNRGEVAPFGS